MKKHNPHTPILIREATDIQPKIWTRFGGLVLGRCKGSADVGTGHGKEVSQSLAGTSDSCQTSNCECTDNYLAGLSDKEIEDKVASMVRTEI